MECKPSTHLDYAGTAWKSNCLAWTLCPQVSCKGTSTCEWHLGEEYTR